MTNTRGHSKQFLGGSTTCIIHYLCSYFFHLELYPTFPQVRLPTSRVIYSSPSYSLPPPFTHIHPPPTHPPSAPLPPFPRFLLLLPFPSLPLPSLPSFPSFPYLPLPSLPPLFTHPFSLILNLPLSVTPSPGTFAGVQDLATQH